MLFNLFGKKEDDADSLFKDKVYIGTTGKMNACAKLAKAQPDTLFIAWFSETANEFKQFFQQQGIEASRVIEAKSIHTSTIQNHTPVFLEHYPLHAKEAELINNWEKGRILAFSALDEPLFKHFGSEKMIPMIKMLGMKEEEAIEHSLVTKSIIGGQQKIADKVSIEQSANSQADWMERNLGA